MTEPRVPARRGDDWDDWEFPQIDGPASIRLPLTEPEQRYDTGSDAWLRQQDELTRTMALPVSAVPDAADPLDPLDPGWLPDDLRLPAPRPGPLGLADDDVALDAPREVIPEWYKPLGDEQLPEIPAPEAWTPVSTYAWPEPWEYGEGWAASGGSDVTGSWETTSSSAIPASPSVGAAAAPEPVAPGPVALEVVPAEVPVEVPAELLEPVGHAEPAEVVSATDVEPAAEAVVPEPVPEPVVERVVEPLPQPVVEPVVTTQDPPTQDPPTETFRVPDLTVRPARAARPAVPPQPLAPEPLVTDGLGVEAAGPELAAASGTVLPADGTPAVASGRSRRRSAPDTDATRWGASLAEGGKALPPRRTRGGAGAGAGPRRAVASAGVAVAAVGLLVGGLLLVNGKHDDGLGPVVEAPPSKPALTAPAATVPPTPTPARTPSPRPVVKPSATPRPTASPTPALAPLVGVAVLNNSRRTGLADRAAQRFANGGWPITTKGNFRGRVVATTVYYPPGERDSALRFAKQFGISRVLPRFAGLPSRGMTIVLTKSYGT